MIPQALGVLNHIANKNRFASLKNELMVTILIASITWQKVPSFLVGEALACGALLRGAGTAVGVGTSSLGGRGGGMEAEDGVVGADDGPVEVVGLVGVDGADEPPASLLPHFKQNLDANEGSFSLHFGQDMRSSSFFLVVYFLFFRLCWATLNCLPAHVGDWNANGFGNSVLPFYEKNKHTLFTPLANIPPKGR